jgi:hypothetical protein
MWGPRAGDSARQGKFPSVSASRFAPAGAS